MYPTGSEYNSLEWPMYLLGSKLNSLEWRNEQTRVAKSTVLSGEMNSLEWRMLQSQLAKVSSGKFYILKWQM